VGRKKLSRGILDSSEKVKNVRERIPAGDSEGKYFGRWVAGGAAEEKKSPGGRLAGVEDEKKYRISSDQGAEEEKKSRGGVQPGVQEEKSHAKRRRSAW
jgi:hypothetical protein